jgi:hypothetical protein
MAARRRSWWSLGESSPDSGSDVGTVCTNSLGNVVKGTFRV